VAGSGQSWGNTRAARPRGEIKPTYPERQRRAGREATVILSVHLDESGRVQTIDVVTPNVATEFLLSALSAAKAIHYDPSLVDGRPTASLLQVRIEYRLE
jgi:TonB family protein